MNLRPPAGTDPGLREGHAPPQRRSEARWRTPLSVRPPEVRHLGPAALSPRGRACPEARLRIWCRTRDPRSHALRSSTAAAVAGSGRGLAKWGAPSHPEMSSKGHCRRPGPRMRRAVRGGECAPPLLGHVAGPQAPSGRPAPEPLEAAFLTLLQRKLSCAQPCRSRNGVFKAAASAFCDPQCDVPERGPPCSV